MCWLNKNCTKRMNIFLHQKLFVMLSALPTILNDHTLFRFRIILIEHTMHRCPQSYNCILICFNHHMIVEFCSSVLNCFKTYLFLYLYRSVQIYEKKTHSPLVWVHWTYTTLQSFEVWILYYFHITRSMIHTELLI